MVAGDQWPNASPELAVPPDITPIKRHPRTFGHASRTRSESLFVEDVTVDAQVSLPYLRRVVSGVVSKGFYESELAVERAQVVALEIDVQVGVDLGEAMALVPALDVGIVTCPCFKANEPVVARLTFGDLQQRRCNSLALSIGMYCEMPDHPAASWPVGKSFAVALEIEKPDDLASVLGHELDGRLFVALLLTLDRVEERRVEERQHAAPQPGSLVLLHVWANHDTHATSLAREPKAIKRRSVRRTEMCADVVGRASLRYARNE